MLGEAPGQAARPRMVREAVARCKPRPRGVRIATAVPCRADP